MPHLLLFSLLLFLIFPLSSADLDISKMRDPKVIIEKVNQGFDVNTARVSDGYTLLHYASEIGNVNLATFLIKKGSVLNPVMKNGRTPLSLAIAFDKKDMIRTLLQEGVDPNFKLGDTDYKRSHFHFFIAKARKINKGVFELFLAKGADLETKDFYTETPLITATQLDFTLKDNAKFLIESGANLKAENRFGKTALMSAVFVQNLEMIDLLIAAGAPVDQVDKQGNSALIAMINMGTGVDSDKLKPKIIEKLLNAEAKIDLANNEGNTALHEAVIGNNLLLLQFLTEQNANTTIQNYKKKTALDQAIINEKWEAVKILLKVEKDLDRLDSYGSTMLHSAIMNEKLELIKLLLDAGANKETKNKWGKTCLELAESQGNPKILEYFQD
jgi:ankyrin repeat protein